MICVNAHTQPHTWTHQMSMRDIGIQLVAIALMPRSKYKHATWRSRATNDGKPWQATVQRKYLGSFAQEEEAAKAVAKISGTLWRPYGTLAQHLWKLISEPIAMYIGIVEINFGK